MIILCMHGNFSFAVILHPCPPQGGANHSEEIFSML